MTSRNITAVILMLLAVAIFALVTRYSYTAGHNNLPGTVLDHWTGLVRPAFP